MPKKDANNKMLLLLFAGSLSAFLLTRKKTQGASFKTTNQHFSTLHPKFRFMFKLFIKRANDLGYTEQINSSYRDFQRQAEIHREDKTSAPAGFSPHNYGTALDVQFKKGKQILNKSTPKQIWLDSGLITEAKKIGLDWGGAFNDNIHFFVRGLNTSKMYTDALKQFKTNNPRLIQGNALKIV
jgi:hypothetical protein